MISIKSFFQSTITHDLNYSSHFAQLIPIACYSSQKRAEYPKSLLRVEFCCNFAVIIAQAIQRCKQNINDYDTTNNYWNHFYFCRFDEAGKYVGHFPSQLV